MSEVEQALRAMSDKYHVGLLQLQEQIDSAKHSNGMHLAAARQQLAMFSKERWLIDKARELAGGNQAALAEIGSLLRSHSAHPHTRLLAAQLLAMIDSPRALELLAGRIVDKSDTDAVRFLCAMLVGNSRNAAAQALILGAINHRSTDEEFDEDKKLRAQMIDSGMSVNLRHAMIVSLLDSAAGAGALAARVKAPLTFQNGWLLATLSLWQKFERDDYILLAADVLRNRAIPERLRIHAAHALYVMRRESKGKRFFPKPAWDALHGVWREHDSGELRRAVGEVLKLQGA